MRSPFPGMDPYLERRWSDVHSTLLSVMKEALQPLLPDDLRARSEERLLLEDKAGDLQVYRGDVAVVELPATWRGDPDGSSRGGAVTLEPVYVEIPFREPVDRFVQIIDRTSGNRVVTVIEVLSPWNKGPGRLNREYRKKLEDYVAADVNVVEVDLLRSPRGRLEVDQADLPVHRRAPYLVCTRLAARPSRWAVYPMPLRQPLPCIPIPLRPKDAPVALDLQPLIDRVYAAGGHDDIDYTKPPDPPLEGEDAVWAAEMITASRSR